MSKDIESGTTKINIQLSIQSPKGFTLPAGCHWDPSVGSGVKNGMVQVLTDDGMLFAQLSYKKDKLDGECLFYDEGRVCEKVNYQNDTKHGWSTSFENGKESISHLYEKGVQKKKLVKYEGEDTWKEVDIKNELNYEICKLDKQLKRQGTCQKYVGGVLVEESLFKDGEFAHKCKEFHDMEMTEFDENGGKIYQGDYKRDMKKGFVRDGKGKEFVDGVVSYVGDWKSGLKDGEGKSMKNSRAYYVGRWKEGLPNGKGELLNEDGSVMMEGEWKHGFLKRGLKKFDYESGKTEFMMPGQKYLYVKGIMMVIHLALMGIFLYLDLKINNSCYRNNTCKYYYEDVWIFNLKFAVPYLLSSLFQLCYSKVMMMSVISLIVMSVISLIVNVVMSIGCLAWYLAFPENELWHYYRWNHDEYLLLLVLSPLFHIYLSVKVYNEQVRTLNRANSREKQMRMVTVNIPGKKWWFVNLGLTVASFFCCILFMELDYQCYRNDRFCYWAGHHKWYYDECSVIHLVGVCIYICVCLMQLFQNKVISILALILSVIFSIVLSSCLCWVGESWTAILYLLYLPPSILLFIKLRKSSKTLPITK